MTSARYARRVNIPSREASSARTVWPVLSPPRTVPLPAICADLDRTLPLQAPLNATCVRRAISHRRAAVPVARSARRDILSPRPGRPIALSASRASTQPTTTPTRTARELPGELPRAFGALEGSSRKGRCPRFVPSAARGDIRLQMPRTVKRANLAYFPVLRLRRARIAHAVHIRPSREAPHAPYARPARLLQT